MNPVSDLSDLSDDFCELKINKKQVGKKCLKIIILKKYMVDDEKKVGQVGQVGQGLILLGLQDMQGRTLSDLAKE